MPWPAKNSTARWTVRRAMPGAAFVIGDSPVTMFDPNRRSDDTRGNAWLSSEQAQSTLPLGAAACLMIRAATSPSPDVRPAGQGLVHGLNMRAYAWADQFLYGPDEA